MKTTFYNSGLGLLSAQSGQPYKLIFTGFKLTDAINFEPTPNNNALPGNLVFTGTDVQMAHVPLTDDEVMIQCLVEHDLGQFDIGSVQLLAKAQAGPDTPFCISVGTSSFRKVPSQSNKYVGHTYLYQLLFSIPQLSDRFSFINLRRNIVEMKHVDTEEDLPYFPWEENYDQLVVDRDTRTNTATFVLNAWDDYWGCPLAADYSSDNMFWKITGGRDGDNFKYVDEA